MRKLNQSTLCQLGLESARPTHVRVLQFGEGNFLRAFVDRMIDDANQRIGFDAGVRIVQPIPRGMAATLKEQDGLYTLILRGVAEGKTVRDVRIVRSVVDAMDPYTDFEAFLAAARDEELRFVVSNTTEAGIALNEGDRLEDAPPASFPAKVTRLLWERYRALGGRAGTGLIFLPCELIDGNGRQLEACVREMKTCSAPRWWIASSRAIRGKRRPRCARNSAMRTP